MGTILNELQAAKYLRVDRAEVRRLLELGALPPLRLGGEYHVREKDLRDYQNGRHR